MNSFIVCILRVMVGIDKNNNIVFFSPNRVYHKRRLAKIDNLFVLRRLKKLII